METRRNRNPVASKFKNNGKDRKLKAEERRKEKSKQIRNARKAKIDEKRNILSEKSLNENEEEGKQKKSVDGGRSDLKSKSKKRFEEMLLWKQNRDKEKKAAALEYKKRQFVVKHVLHSPAKFLKSKETKCNKRTKAASKANEKTTETKFKNNVSEPKVDVKNDEIEIKKKGDENQTQDQLSTDAGKKQFDTGNSQNSEQPSKMDNDGARSELESDNQPPESESPKTHIIAPPGKTPKRQKILRNLDLPLDSEGFTPRRIKSTAHFKKIVEVERQKLTCLNNKWNSLLSEENLAEEVTGKIRTVIGQAQLLMDQRFKQFLGLIDVHQSKNAAKDATSADLQGFWDMISFQIDDVNKKFLHLKTQKENGWQDEKAVKPKGKKKQIEDKAPSNEASKSRKESLRNFKLAMKAKMKASKSVSDDVDSVQILTGSNVNPMTCQSHSVSCQMDQPQPRSETCTADLESVDNEASIKDTCDENSKQPRSDDQGADQIFAKYLCPSTSEESEDCQEEISVSTSEVFRPPENANSKRCPVSILDMTIEDIDLEAPLI